MSDRIKTGGGSSEKKPALSALQIAFAHEYMVDRNGTKAAMRAGYAERSAAQTAARLLRNDKIRAYLEPLERDMQRRTGVDADRVVAELAKIGFSNAGEFFNWGPDGISINPRDALTIDQQSIVTSVKEKRTIRHIHGDDAEGYVETVHTEIKLADKLTALDKLARHLGMYNDNLTIKPGAEVQELLDLVDGATRGRLPSDSESG